MADFDITWLADQGFGDPVSIRSLKLSGGCCCISTQPGVYAVYRVPVDRPEFKCKSGCGKHKGRNPTVDKQILNDRWVDGDHILYLGKAGKSLQRRIAEYMKAGSGRSHGHWGGRYIWQIKDCDDLLIAWKPLSDEDPREIERYLIGKFQQRYGRLPFANLRR